MIDHPLPDRDAWVQLFSSASLPVLRSTRRHLEDMRQDLDSIDSRRLTQLVLRDPIMTVRVLAYIQPFRGRSLQHDISTIAGAVMMAGLLPFFRRFDALPTIEGALANESPQALLGVLHVIRRAQRAAEYAHDWAIRRHDMNLEEVRSAALLHDLAEILVWCFAPRLALAIQTELKTCPGTRSADAQTRVLGLTYLDIQLALCKVWHLPELLTQLMDDTLADNARVRNVTLAVRLARHSASDWNDPALPDDYRDIGSLLNLSADAVRHHLGVPDGEDQPQ